MLNNTISVYYIYFINIINIINVNMHLYVIYRVGKKFLNN